MDVYNAKTARQIVAAWNGHSARNHLLSMFASDQRVCANLALQLGRRMESENHLRAAEVIEAAL